MTFLSWRNEQLSTPFHRSQVSGLLRSEPFRGWDRRDTGGSEEDDCMGAFFHSVGREWDRVLVRA